MQSVSAGWKAAQQETLVPESFVEVSYRVGDPAAQLAASATDNGAWVHANTAQIVDGLDKVYKPYVTFEENMWPLDGSRRFLPAVVTQDMGYISSVLSEEGGVFAVMPVITISFSSLQTTLIPGVTVRWSEAFDECASEFTVTAYNGATVVATRSITGNTRVLCVIEEDIVNYDKIEVVIEKWCKRHHRARVEDILIGAISVFTKSELLGFEHNQYASLLSAELPKSQVVFSLQNVDGEWNPDNPQGLWRYLLERQEISVRYGFKIGGAIEWVRAGTFYMSEWDTPSNGITATFTARDLLEYMQGAFVRSTSTLTLHALATQALTQSGLPKTASGADRWSIDSALSAITVTLPDDFSFTCAEVVQLCANAACCVFYQNREGVLVVEPLANTLTDYVIDQNVSYANAEYRTNKELRSVNVNDGMGTATNSATGEVQEVKNVLVQSGGVANAVAAWVRDCLKHRKTLSGEYRADPRLDVLDKITVENKFATSAVFVTSAKYSYGGAFRGEYEGLVVASE